jgi:hypothetical protein
MDMQLLVEPVRVMLRDAAQLLPRLALAVLILVGGWLLAKAARFAIVKALRAINFHVLTGRAGMDNFLRQGGMERDTTDLVGLLVYWLVLLAALLVAFNTVGLTYITDVLGQVVLFVPRVLLALLVLAFGTYFAVFIGATVSAYCRNARIADGELLGSLARYAIVVFVVLIALDQVNVGGEIVRQSFLIILAGVVFALALAFGLGGRDWAARLLERWWPRDPGNRP